jgi:single-strand DNA-binding protein
MRDINKVILIGRLGSNPVQRSTKSGYTVVNFSVATSRKIQKQGAAPNVVEYIEETEWHRIVTWGKQGENCAQYLGKGSLVYIEGSIRSHQYDDKSGSHKTAYEIHADAVRFLSSRQKSEFHTTESHTVGQAQMVQEHREETDIPLDMPQPMNHYQPVSDSTAAYSFEGVQS